ncbi:MAG: stage II sporulation protein D [Clostridia bacterium]|nr:stage II sporulation protein D [Clostridia bacterium]
MKKYGLLCILLSFFLLLIPLLRYPKKPNARPTAAMLVKDDPVPAKQGVTDTFRLLHSDSGKVETLSAKDYLCGVVAGEMPPTYEAEALKAQVVAAYTFACRRKANNKDKSYDISDDCTVDQACLSKADACKKWGEKAEEYLQKIEKAVDEVYGFAVLYDGDLALTAYHAVSSGRTESSADIWGGEVPYLISVTSDGDRTAPNYKNTATFTPTDFADRCTAIVTLSGDPEKWVGEMTRTGAGSVKTVMLGGKQISGADLRAALGLKSSNFEIACQSDKITVTTFGYGHGVGMSQYGANEMAKQGSGFAEILGWYYPGCTVRKITA